MGLLRPFEITEGTLETASRKWRAHKSVQCRPVSWPRASVFTSAGWVELGCTSPRFTPHSLCPQTCTCAHNTPGIFTETPYSLRFKHTYLRVPLRFFLNQTKLSVACSVGRTARAVFPLELAAALGTPAGLGLGTERQGQAWPSLS